MTKAKKFSIGILSSVVFACALFCTANFAFADENPLQKIQDMLNNLYSGNDIVAQDVYGVFGGEYAVAKSVSSFEGGQDTAVDLVKTDGTKLFHTSTATTKSEKDPVWSDNMFFTTTYESQQQVVVPQEYGVVGYNLENTGRADVYNKTTHKKGKIDIEGNIVIPIEFDYLNYSNLYRTYDAAAKIFSDHVDYYIYDSDNQLVGILNRPETSGHPFISWIGNKYFYTQNSTAPYQSYFKIEDNTIIPLNDIAKIETTATDDAQYLNVSTILVYNNGDVYVEKNDGSTKKITTIQETEIFSYNSVSFSGHFIRTGSNNVKYFTMDGAEITSKIPAQSNPGYRISENYCLCANHENNITYILDTQGNTIKQLNGLPVGSYGLTPNFCLYNVQGSTISVDVYGGNLNKIKMLKQNQVPTGKTLQSIDWFPRKTQAFEGSQLRFNWTDHQDTQYYYFDTQFNERPTSDMADYQTLTGTKVYLRHAQYPTIETKYTDFNGNDILINGYKLAVYQDGTINYNENCVKHYGSDVWWAVNSEGKHGAIDSYGNIIVPFVYEKEMDTGLDGTDYALCYRNGKWETVLCKEQPTPKPKPVVDSTTESTVTLSWSAVEGAEKYAVATKNDDGTFKTYTNNLTKTTYTISGLKANTTYKCLVQASVNGKWSTFTDSDLVTATTKPETPTPKPQPVVDSVSENSISLSWPAIENADKYAVATQNDDGSFKTYTNSIKDTKYTITGLTEGITYKCLVQASVNGKWSDFTEEDLVSATTKSNHPKPQLVDKGDGYANIKWDAIPGATKYAIAEMENGKYRNYSTECTETTYHCDDLANGYGHNLLVQAYVNGKWTNFTKDDYLLVEIEGTTVKPTTEVESTTDHSVTLKWNHVPGAKGYAAAVRDNSGKYKSVFVGPEKLTSTIEGLTDSASYDCLTQANIYGTWSAFTEKDFVAATTKGNRPAPREVKTGDGYADIEWDAIPGATAYAIATMENGKYKNYSITCTDTSYHCDNLANGYSHYLLVQAYVDGKWSPFSKDNYLLVDVDGPTKKPTTKVESTTDNSVTISWNQVPGAKEYAVAVRDNDRNYKSVYVPVVEGKEYPSKATISGLKDGYNYKAIVQSNIFGTWSSFSEEEMADAKTTSNRPAPKQTAIGDGYADIAWDAIPNATAYAIAEMENGKYRNYTTEWTGTTYHCDNLANGYDHYILVQAYVNGAWTQFDKSNYLTVHPEGATKPTTTVSATTENSITLSWAKVAGATEYAAAVRDASGKYYSVYTGADATSATITGLTTNTNYKAIVQCKIYGAWSSFTEAEMKDAKTSAALAPIAIYNDTNPELPTLTFYYDANDHSSQGTVYSVGYNSKGAPNWHTEKTGYFTNVKKVIFDSSFVNYKPTSTKLWFGSTSTSVLEYRNKLESIENIQYLNTSESTDMYGMFCFCTNLKTLDLSNFNTAKCTNMSEMFNVTGLTSLNCSTFNTSKVTDMSYMFESCQSLESLNVSSFDTANVTNMEGMFSLCYKLTTLDITSFRFSKVSNTISMFLDDLGLTNIYCNENLASNPGILTSGSMFSSCSKLPHYDKNKTDKTYAYPNNGTTGYFTAKA